METILNVFPLSEAPESPNIPKQNNKKSEPSLYWFSQTIGEGRGIEPVILAMGNMQTPVSLYLRGNPASGYLEKLMQLAQDSGVRDRVHILPQASPSEMAKLASKYDAGLSLEINEPRNRAICLTNKIFTYLLAGLPIILSQTPAQEALAKQLGEAAVLINLDKPESLAKTLDNWFSHPEYLTKAQVKAWQLGQEVYNWDVEKNKFLKIIERIWQ